MNLLFQQQILLKHVYNIQYGVHDNIACWEFRSFPNMITDSTVAFCIFVADMVYHTNNTDATNQPHDIEMYPILSIASHIIVTTCDK